MAKFPEIETSRLQIVPFNETFLSDNYVGWLNDPNVVKYSQQRFSTHTIEECRDFMNGFEKSPHHFCAITTKSENSQHIGNVSTTVDQQNKVSDIAIMIGDRSFWGRGYGEEAWRAIIENLISEGMRLVTGGCMANNISMVRVMEKSGMKHYYTRKDFFLFNGMPIDSVHYVAEASSWGK